MPEEVRVAPDGVGPTAAGQELPDLGPEVLFGPGRLAELPELAQRLAGRRAEALIVCDPGIVAIGLAARVAAVLSGSGVAVRSFSAISSNPTARQVDEAAGAAAALSDGLVIGLGGGSALDVAKLAAATAGSHEPAEAFSLGARPLPARRLPLIAVPTTAGTGAEVTRTVVFSDGGGRKLWAWGEVLRPDAVLLDPDLTTELPAVLTAATGVDALVHAIEAATNRRADEESRRWALPAVGLVCRYLPRAVRDGSDREARGALLTAACLAGRAIDRAGTGVAHAFGHALSTLGGVHHGRAVGLSLAAAFADNAAAAPAAHAEVARAMGLAGAEREISGAAARRYGALLEEVGLRRALDDHGLGPADAERLAAEVMAPANRPMLEANCRRYGPADCLALARAILSAG